MFMIENRLYELGKNLGLHKREIDNIISLKLKKHYDMNNTVPINVYKDSCKYGTISINDFQ